MSLGEMGIDPSLNICTMRSALHRTSGQLNARADGGQPRPSRKGTSRPSQAVLAGANSFLGGLAAGSKPFSGQTRWARLLGHHARQGDATSAPIARRSLVIQAVFERFTELSIKAVMLSQQEAKLFHSPQVRLLCVLLNRPWSTRLPA